MPLEENLALRRDLGDPLGIAAALGNLGILAQDQGDYSRAVVLFEQDLTME